MRIKYCPPPFEEVQHEVCKTRKLEDGTVVPAETSLHTDVSLLQRIDKMSLSAQTLKSLKESMQPMIDSSNMSAKLRSEFEDAFGALTDDDLINSCPSRYIQTSSEKRAALEQLTAQHKADLEKAQKAAKEKSESDKLAKEQEEFESQMKDFLRNIY